jgi:nicotinamide mononucleotide transporter
MMKILEILTVICSLAFIYLIIKEQIIGWIWGIAASFISVYIFYHSKLYAESFLYFFYVIAGIYGYFNWKKSAKNSEFNIGEWQPKVHSAGIFVCVFLSVLLGHVLKNYTDAKLPRADSFSTVFSIYATYLEAKKILSAWLFWIALNLFSIWLYYSRDLPIYASLMVVYSVLSVVGYRTWRKKMQLQRVG